MSLASYTEAAPFTTSLPTPELSREQVYAKKIMGELMEAGQGMIFIIENRK